MSVHPKLREAITQNRDLLLEHAAAALNCDNPKHRMKARFALNVVTPFNDWFLDEAEKGNIAEVARCAAEGLGHMAALLASTAGDDMMEQHVHLILQVMTTEIARHLTTNTE